MNFEIFPYYNAPISILQHAVDRQISKGSHGKARLINLFAGSIFSLFSVIYHAAGFSLKLVELSVRILTGWIPVFTNGKMKALWKNFSSEFSLRQLMEHAARIILFSFSIVFCPVVGVISPHLNRDLQVKFKMLFTLRETNDWNAFTLDYPSLTPKNLELLKNFTATELEERLFI